MESNTPSSLGPAGRPDGLAGLTAAVDDLAARDLTGLPDAVQAERVLELRRLLDRLEGQWRKELAAVDGRGAAGAEQSVQVGSTASWLRHRLRLGAGAASSSVRTARALFGGPLTATATALRAGEISVAHAAVLAHGTHDLPDHVTAEAEPALVEAAGRLDPPRLRRVLGHLRQVADPEAAGVVGTRGWGQVVLAALEPLACPTAPRTGAAGISGGLMRWWRWLAGPWRAGCPRLVGYGRS